MPRSPNFLIVVAEQFTALVDPNYQPCLVDAPSLAGLASGATRFRRAYCNAPVCGPSRLSFLTGLFACNNGGYDNGSVLAPHMPTFGHLLTRSGYQTAMCGRMHIHGLDQHVGFEKRLVSEMINPDLCNPGDRKGPEVDAAEPPEPASDRRLREPKWSDSPIHRHDEYVTEQALRFLRAVSRGGDQPFCLVVGYHAAHSGARANPACAPLYDKYIERDLPATASPIELFGALPEHARWAIKTAGDSDRACSPAQQRRRVVLYLASVEFFDRQLGKLLDALADAGLADDTIVVVTSDHGEGMGRHGLWGKMVFYDEVQRIPMYVRVPGRGAQVVDECVSLVDIAPTLADFAGVDASVPFDGRSIRPLVERTREEREDAVVFSEYHGYRAPCDMYMVVKGRFKYCHYLAEQDELYDLEADPDEMRNLAPDPAHADVASGLMAEVRARVDVERMSNVIQLHNARRDLVHQSYEASEAFRRMAIDRHEAFRRKLDEPWWDGGEYLHAGMPWKAAEPDVTAD